jgi:hypothetical protein
VPRQSNRWNARRSPDQLSDTEAEVPGLRRDSRRSIRHPAAVERTRAACGRRDSGTNDANRGLLSRLEQVCAPPATAARSTDSHCGLRRPPPGAQASRRRKSVQVPRVLKERSRAAPGARSGTGYCRSGSPSSRPAIAPVQRAGGSAFRERPKAPGRSRQSEHRRAPTALRFR